MIFPTGNDHKTLRLAYRLQCGVLRYGAIIQNARCSSSLSDDSIRDLLARLQLRTIQLVRKLSNLVGG